MNKDLRHRPRSLRGDCWNAEPSILMQPVYEQTSIYGSLTPSHTSQWDCSPPASLSNTIDTWTAKCSPHWSRCKDCPISCTTNGSQLWIHFIRCYLGVRVDRSVYNEGISSSVSASSVVLSHKIQRHFNTGGKQDEPLPWRSAVCFHDNLFLWIWSSGGLSVPWTIFWIRDADVMTSTNDGQAQVEPLYDALNTVLFDNTWDCNGFNDKVLFMDPFLFLQLTTPSHLNDRNAPMVITKKTWIILCPTFLLRGFGSPLLGDRKFPLTGPAQKK